MSDWFLNRALDVFGEASLTRGRTDGGYFRVRAGDQNLNRQLAALGQCDRVFTNKISGESRAKRKALAELIGYIRDGDTGRIASMDRISRDTSDLYKLVDEITGKAAEAEFVNENITVDRRGPSLTDSLMPGILAAFAEFERRRIKERQAEGITIAQARGTYVPQPKLSPRTWNRPKRGSTWASQRQKSLPGSKSPDRPYTLR